MRESVNRERRSGGRNEEEKETRRDGVNEKVE